MYWLISEPITPAPEAAAVCAVLILLALALFVWGEKNR